MELANQGWIQGKLLKTVGNLGNEPRTIYTYRNIPYADHSQFLRFQVETIMKRKIIHFKNHVRHFILAISAAYKVIGY